MEQLANHATEQPIINIQGERVALGPLSRTHLPLYRQWLNDFATQAWAGFPARPEPWSEERATAWYERVATETEMMGFDIFETSSWRVIGACLLREINQRHRTAEFGITLGDVADRGKGYGTEAVQLLLDLAFTGLGLNNVQLQVYAFNTGAIRSYQKAGFREIGRRRQAYAMNGKAWDIVYMDCLASEFISPVLGRLIGPGTSR